MNSVPGFIVNGVELSGFMRYDVETPIPFSQRLTVITGPTGSGKTSILDSITYSLYGRSSRTDEKLKIEDLVDEDGYVQLKFSQDGQDYSVTRGRKNGRNFLSLFRQNERIAGTTSELEERIKNLVGLDYKGFVNSTFIRQDEMKQLGSETGAERLDIFERLFRLEIFEKAQQIADAKLRECETDSASMEGELVQKKNDYEVTLSAERNELKVEKKEESRLSKELDNAKRSLAELEKTHEKFEPLHREYEAATSKISELEKEIGDLNVDIEEAEKQNRKRSKLLEELAEFKTSPGEEKKLIAEKTELESLEEKSSGIRSQIAIHEKIIEKAKKDAAEDIKEAKEEQDQQHARLAQFRKSMSKEEAFGLLRLDGALKERLSRITREMTWLKDSPSLISALKIEQSKTGEELPRVKSKIEKIESGTFVKGEIKETLARITVRIGRIETRSKEKIQAEEIEIRDLEKQLEKIKFGKEEEKRLQLAKEKLKEITKSVKKFEALNEQLEAIPDQRSGIDGLRKQIERKEGEKTKLEKKKEDLQKDEKGFVDCEEKLGELEDTKSNLSTDLAKKEGEITRIEKRIKELEALGPKIEKLEADLKEFERKKEIFKILKQEVFHRKGILVFAINQLLQGISIEASLILGDLTDQRLSNIRITPTSEVRGGSVLIEVEGVDGLFRDVSAFSGGEKTQINGAIRFAIAKELSRMPQIGRSYGNMKTLFIDEGDLGSLDTETARVNFVRKLMNLGEFFERIILITHITEVAETFPNRIRVYMTPEKNSRVELGEILA